MSVIASRRGWKYDSLSGMSKTFRAWDVDQSWLLPPSVHEFVPAGHVAHFIRDTVRESLDLSAVMDAYVEERGYREMPMPSCQRTFIRAPRASLNTYRSGAWGSCQRAS